MCSIKMTTFKSSFGYILNDMINVRIAAVNLEGAGNSLIVTDN
jgi:hypothetical protein